MDALTYSLRVEGLDSEKYYSDAGRLADELMIFSEKHLSPILNGYLRYLAEFNLEKIREKEEYYLELLSFGILWRTYAATALSVNIAPFVSMAKMGEWRKKHQNLKPAIDFVRGIFISLFLLPDVKRKNISSAPTLGQIDHICKWFEATGEFREQALRFIRWRAYWGTLSASKQTEIFSSITNLVNWFDYRSTEVLGKYTGNVERFVTESKRKYRWREDRISCSRTRLEYHLNMAGACLMNRAFRKDFKNTAGAAVLLPGCMRFRSKEDCEAEREQKGLKCSGCEPKCRVNHLRLIGEKNDFEVYVIPHASDLSLWTPEEGKPRRGVVASACATTLVEGGWELKRYGVPAQCVLLEYCGCKKHWHPEGVQTELNKRELDRILQNRIN